MEDPAKTARIVLRLCVAGVVLAIVGIPAAIIVWNSNHPPKPLALEFFQGLHPDAWHIWSGDYGGYPMTSAEYTFKSDRARIVSALKKRLTREDGWQVEDNPMGSGTITFMDCTQESRGYIFLFPDKGGETHVSIQQRPPPPKGWAVNIHLIR